MLYFASERKSTIRAGLQKISSGSHPEPGHLCASCVQRETKGSISGMDEGGGASGGDQRRYPFAVLLF